MITGPDPATLDDFEAILELVDACFSREQHLGGMLERWGHCYVPTEQGIGQFLVMRDDGRPVSAVEAVDQTVRIGRGRIRVAGLTAVATYPDYRGQGLMTRLLKAWMPRMRELGYALSDLGGDRVRYGRFGWENGPADWQFAIYGRSLAAEKVAGGMGVSQVSAGEILSEAHRIQVADGFGGERDPAAMARVLGRGGAEVWAASDNDGLSAYVVCYPGDDGGRRIAEFGGTEPGVDTVVRHLKESCGAPRLTVRCPRTHLLLEYFFRISDHWELTATRMTKVVDLEKTLRGFSDQLSERWGRAGIEGERSISLAIEESGMGVALRLTPKGVEVSAVAEEAAIVQLPEKEMVRLLFGDDAVRRTAEWEVVPGWFAGLLPLDYFLWPLERV